MFGELLVELLVEAWNAWTSILRPLQLCSGLGFIHRPALELHVFSWPIRLQIGGIGWSLGDLHRSPHRRCDGDPGVAREGGREDEHVTW